jgi:hypothetical protein
MKIGFFGILQILLIVLKLMSLITISWWAVFIPVYIALFLGAVMATLVLMVAAR